MIYTRWAVLHMAQLIDVGLHGRVLSNGRPSRQLLQSERVSRREVSVEVTFVTSDGG